MVAMKARFGPAKPLHSLRGLHCMVQTCAASLALPKRHGPLPENWQRRIGLRSS